MNQEEYETPPVKQIRDRLSEFEMRIPVWGLTVFTVDGYIIAHKLFYEGIPKDIELAVSSMSAGLITISENFIQMIDNGMLFRQVLIDADDSDGAHSFSILLEQIAENVMLACIFPSALQLGLVTFELNNLCKDIQEILSMWDIKLHVDTVT